MIVDLTPQEVELIIDSLNCYAYKFMSYFHPGRPIEDPKWVIHSSILAKLQPAEPTKPTEPSDAEFMVGV